MARREGLGTRVLLGQAGLDDDRVADEDVGRVDDRVGVRVRHAQLRAGEVELDVLSHEARLARMGVAMLDAHQAIALVSSLVDIADRVLLAVPVRMRVLLAVPVRMAMAGPSNRRRRDGEHRHPKGKCCGPAYLHSCLLGNGPPPFRRPKVLRPRLATGLPLLMQKPLLGAVYRPKPQG